MDVERVKKKVLEEYAPSDEELEELNSLYLEIKEFIEEHYDVETQFAGSASRGTCMTADKDIDIFILFPDSLSNDELEGKGFRVGKKVFEQFNADYNVEYAEHPYTKGEVNGHEVEIVPCYDVEAGQVESSVDRTPHHTEWVQNNLDEEQRKDVIVLKAFLKNAGIYGSSLKTRGLSGYLCEVLIGHYRSFEDLIENASSWKEEELIDPEEHHEELPEQLKEKFENESLRVIDPVDPDRNVASVLSKENYSRFVYQAIQFDERPGMEFFRQEERDVSEFELDQELERHSHFLVMDFETPQEVDDIVYPQMRKTLRAITRLIEEHDFRIYDQGFFVGDRAKLFFELDPRVPKIEYVQGPKVFHGRNHLREFKSKYDNTFVEEDRLKAKTEREFTDVKDLLNEKLEEPKKIGVPERIAEKIMNFTFQEPLKGDSEWLKHLAKELHYRGDTDG